MLKPRERGRCFMRRNLIKRSQALFVTIQQLEPRRLLADTFAVVQDLTLVVTGDGNDNVIIVTPNDTTGMLDATLDGQTLSFDPTQIESIRVDAGAGNDQVSVLSRRPANVLAGDGD